MMHKKSKDFFYIIEKLANINHTVLLSNNKSYKHDYFLPDGSNFPLKACSVKACFNFYRHPLWEYKAASCYN